MPSNATSPSANASTQPDIGTLTASPLAPWRSPLSRALHRNRSQPFCRFLQLATLRPDGTPANRTLVFRGFFDSLANQLSDLPLEQRADKQDGNQLVLISDRRSEKIQQIQLNPNAEACWYFTKTREQFRLSGQLQVVAADTEDLVMQKARDRVWQNISDNARLQFAWPDPKVPRIEDPEAFKPSAPDSQTPPTTFCLLLLSPHHVDHLSLRGEPQNRTLYEKITANDWRTMAVNP